MRNYLFLLFFMFSASLLSAQTLSGIITYETQHKGSEEGMGEFELNPEQEGTNEMVDSHFKAVEDSMKKAAKTLYHSGSYSSQTTVYFAGASAYVVMHTHRANVHVLGNKDHDSYIFQRVTTAGCEMAGKANEHPAFLMDSCTLYHEADLQMGDSTKTILDMECQLWYWQKNEIKAKLWITQELPMSVAPAQQQFVVPRGTVLAVEFAGFYKTIATNIEIRPIDQHALESTPLVELDPAHLLD